uniref:Class II Histidinyl-tRNA synthetase (HisRS)-like catalytic core domain-containing protein n=1 Tax=Nelumbo nucifera TaxID=4432 RepID=A0A822XY52_NELNU|nr:TPA_asm: hypothetical protein HUJ06_026701 [Nelumbo nucifera]
MSSFKRYEISWVYRKAIGHSTPNRYLQVAMDIITRFFYPDSCDIRLNHGHLLDAMWTWIGIEVKLRHSVAELLSTMGSLRPQSSERKSRWVFIRRQLLQDLNLTETVVNRLQTVGLRLCGPADQALPRLRGALPPDKPICKALEELSALCGYLRVWGIERHVFLDALMPPTENYHRDIFFQIYLNKENNTGSVIEGALLAIGGRYDHLLHPMWDHEYKSNPPGAVGTSLALEKIVQHSLVEIRPSRNESGTDFLICSRGSGGLLKERMELAAELWQANIKAQFVPMQDPSLTEQYEYANEHDIKCLIIITNTGLSPTDSVKVPNFTDTTPCYPIPASCGVASYPAQSYRNGAGLVAWGPVGGAGGGGATSPGQGAAFPQPKLLSSPSDLGSPSSSDHSHRLINISAPVVELPGSGGVAKPTGSGALFRLPSARPAA